MLRSCDVVICALPESPETIDLFDAAMFAAMRPGSLFINVGLGWYVWTHPDMIKGVDDLIRIGNEIFSEDEMAMLGGIIGYWFGSRGNAKK